MLHVWTALWVFSFPNWTKNTSVRDNRAVWKLAEQSECQGFYVPRVHLSALTQTTAFHFVWTGEATPRRPLVFVLKTTPPENIHSGHLPPDSWRWTRGWICDLTPSTYIKIQGHGLLKRVCGSLTNVNVRSFASGIGWSYVCESVDLVELSRRGVFCVALPHAGAAGLNHKSWWDCVSSLLTHMFLF